MSDGTLPGPTVALPGGGAMPLLGFGTWQLRGREAYDAVRAALEVGYRHLDTATIYRNETEVGAAIRDSGVPRSEVFLTTKLPPERAGAERATLERSLADLGVDAVDLWLIHWPPHRGAGTPTWEAFLDLRREGLVRDVGVSNYDLGLVDELVAATGTGPAVDQVRWGPSLHDPRFASGLADRDVVLEGYSPFKSTRLRDAVLRRIADAHGVSPTQVVVRWHLQHGFVVIPKSARRERIAANADVFGFELGEDDMAAIDAMGR